ncbi:MAG TPA: TonB-dependent siderophore receptor, partial [Azonexus sp.]|nr:TonB-dependent siderophore receptor [Azonexus sp.]
MTPPFPSRPRPIAGALRAALLGLALAAPLTLATIAPAQAQSAARSYQIAAGRLDATLTAFAAAADITLSFDAAQTRGLRSAGLNGAYTTAG